MVLETLQLLLPHTHSPSRTAPISDTVFFTWYVHLCLPKPLETVLKSVFHIFNQWASLSRRICPKFPSTPFSFSFPTFFSTCLHFPASSPHAHTHLNFLSSPLQLCYRVVSVTADHQSGGSAGDFRSRRGSQLSQCLQPAPRLESQAPLRPCHGQRKETPGQATETLPAAGCLMLTTERIQAKGGEVELNYFSGFESISCLF